MNFPAEEQGIKKAPEDEDLAIETGEEDEEPDKTKGREHLRDEDAISDEEEGFLEGASGIGSHGLCTTCRKPLGDNPRKIVEKEVDGEVQFFCSTRCAQQAT